MKKFITVIVTLALCAGSFVGCTYTKQQQEYARMMLFSRASYASTMRFVSIEGSGMMLSARIYDGKYNDLVLVMSEAESVGYSEDVLVAWPSEQTEGILDRLNQRVSKSDIDVEPYNLSYPITMTDVVVNWQDVTDLIVSIEDFELIIDPDYYTIPQPTQ
ncbi:MAG: hypothetical protein LBG68_00885 [Coriobacteriales bacterium]|nr:hypothetical protein [Coriobacteriales bacterium]